METTERIVESYCRYVEHWFTIPNIKCEGQYEIDLLGVELRGERTIGRYHIESGVSISGAYSRLTAKEYSPDRLKKRVEQAGQRRTLGYFRDRKFSAQPVVETPAGYGFRDGNYSKIIVTWGWTDEAKTEADRAGIVLWEFRDILRDLANLCGNLKSHFTDDTLRAIQLFVRKE